MFTQLYKAENRGLTKIGWLTSYHSFSFGNFYNADLMGFGALRVLNDDLVKAGFGFSQHPHSNMEIISIPLHGKLYHADTLGNTTTIETGEIQIMSAGSGIEHSEKTLGNLGDVSFLQIWIIPNVLNSPPSYGQLAFSLPPNEWQLLVHPHKKNALAIKQKAAISMIALSATQKSNYNLEFTGNDVFLFNLSGEVVIADKALKERDAIGIKGSSTIGILANSNAQILAIEVPKIN